MDQAQLIREIEQQVDNLSYLDEDLFNQYCDKYYDENDEPIVELFTPQLLQELTESMPQLAPPRFHLLIQVMKLQ